jgi:hypothetical protein
MIRDDIAEHYMNNSTDPTWNTPTTARLQAKFFKAIGMKHWSDFSRIVALGAARDALQEYASDPTKNAKQLAELGVTPDQIRDYFATEGADFDTHPEVATALNRWVDQSLVRPGANMRPAWGSDPRFALIWHLKDFMWGFNEVVMKRAIAQSKEMKNVGKALPFIMMGGALMPLAMVGAELRRWLANDLPAKALGVESRAYRPEGGDYWLDLLDRTGAAGPLQILLDMNEASDHGRFALLSAMGPSLSLFQDFLIGQSQLSNRESDLSDYFKLYSRMVPVLSQSKTLREYVADKLP